MYPLTKEIDSQTKAIMICIAKNPSISGYMINRKTKIPRNVVVRKIGRQQLIERGILVVKEDYVGKRQSKLYSITFRGLLFALKKGIIQAEDVFGVRNQNKINLPFDHLSSEQLSYLENEVDSPIIMSRIAETCKPKIFYTLLREWVDPFESTTESIAITCVLAGLITMGILGRIGERVRKPPELRNLNLSELRVSKALTDSILVLLKPILPMETRKLIDQSLLPQAEL